MEKEHSARTAAHQLFAGGILSKGVTLVGSIITARILTPEDYGYNLSITVVAGFLGMLSFSGFETYYVQKRDISIENEQKLLANIFSLRIIQNLLLFFIHLILAWFLIAQDTTLGYLISITSLVHLSGIIGKPSEAVLSKQFNFGPIVKSNAFRDISSVCTKIGFASAGFGAYSFAIALVIGSIIRQVSLFLSIKRSFSYAFDREIIKPILGFGSAVMIGGIGNFIKTYSDKIILTAYYPKSQIGLFDFARGQSDIVNTYFLYPQNSLVLSYLSKYKNDRTKIKQLFTALGTAISYFFLPCFTLLIIYIHELVIFVFGAKWIEAIPLFKLFIIFSAHSAIMYPTQAILTSLGKPQIKTKISIIFTIISIITLLLAVKINIDIYKFCLLYLSITILSDYAILYISLKYIRYNPILFVKNRLSTAIPLILITLYHINYNINTVIIIFYLVFIMYIFLFKFEKIRNMLEVLLGKEKTNQILKIWK